MVLPQGINTSWGMSCQWKNLLPQIGHIVWPVLLMSI